MRSRLAGVPNRYSVSSCSLTCISTTLSGYAVLMESINVLSSSVVLSLYVVTMPITITQKREVGKHQGSTALLCRKLRNLRPQAFVFRVLFGDHTLPLHSNWIKVFCGITWPSKAKQFCVVG